jgi:hypothetical protein
LVKRSLPGQPAPRDFEVDAMPPNALRDDDHDGSRCATPVRPANDHRQLPCAFMACLPCGARPPRERSPKGRRRPSPTRSGAIASGCPARPVEASTGTLGSRSANERNAGAWDFVLRALRRQALPADHEAGASEALLLGRVSGESVAERQGREGAGLNAEDLPASRGPRAQGMWRTATPLSALPS